MTRKIDWEFGRPLGRSKQRDPVQEQFFNNSSAIASIREALVREAIQNVLDQAASPGGPVRVRFYISGDSAALDSNLAAKYTRGLWAHAYACGAKDITSSQRCRFLLIEDFETTGLVGDPAALDASDQGEVNAFYYFFRREGASGKAGGKAGSRGVGKITIPMSSALQSFFGYTIRENDHYSDCGLLLGEATMNYHSIDGERFEPDGWWGDAPNREEDPVLPLTDRQVIDEFKSDWRLSRTDEPGLSIVIPYVGDGWSPKEVARSVIEDYFIAITQGRLSVVIDSAEAPSISINSSSLPSVVDEVFEAEARSNLRSDIDAIAWATSEAPLELGLEMQGPPAWQSANVDESSLEAARRSFFENGRVLINVPVDIAHKALNRFESAKFRVLLLKDPNRVAPPYFSRAGIWIKNASTKKLQGARAVALIDEVALSAMLANAESGAHTEWVARSKNFANKYEQGQAWLRWIKDAPSELLRLLVAVEDIIDETLAQDFFSLPPAQKGLGARGPGGENATDGGTGDVDPPPENVPRSLNVSPKANGFSVTLAKGKPAPTSAVIQVGYSVTRGRAVEKWEPVDFVFGGRGRGPAPSVSFKGCSIRAFDNEIHVSDIDADQFSVEVSGFDANRDLTVEWQEKQ